MKTKIALVGFLTSLLLIIGCDDSIDSIGMNMLPDKEQISARIDSFFVTGKTIKVDSIYAKTVNGLLGRFIDPVYGDITAGYMCQFVPPPASWLTKNDLIGDSTSVESICLQIVYTSYTGDSLTPMEVTVYPITKPLSTNHYVYTQPDKANQFLSEYYNENNILGKAAYTARNLNRSDSLNAASSLKAVTVPLPMELATTLFEEYKKNGISKEFLAKHLPGVYLKPTFGSGCLIHVEYTYISINLKRRYELESILTSKRDSIDYEYPILPFDVTKEVVQINSYTGNDDYLTAANNDKMYIKSPTGIFTELTIPIEEIRNGDTGKSFSSVQLILKTEPKAESSYPLNFPGTGIKTPLGNAVSRLLLIEVNKNDSIINDFFEKKKDPDNTNSYVTTFNSVSGTYSFDNIANMIRKAMKDPDKKSLTVRLIPIQMISSTQSSYYSSTTIEYSSANYLYPSAVTLKKEKKEDLQVKVLSTDLKQ